MANLANLVVKIKADTKGMNKGMSDATRAMKKFKQIAKAAAGAFVVKKTIDGFKALTGAIRGAQEALDALGKAGASLGISLERMQQFSFIAARSGVEVSTLNTSLQIMANNIVDASEGTGEAGDALRKLGIDAINLKSQKVDQQFFSIARAFRAISSDAEKVNIARSLFGRGGVGIIQIFDSNMQGLIQRFGELRQATSETEFKAIEAANDQFTDLGVIIDGIKDKVAANLAPAFLEFGKIIEETIKDYGGIGEVTNNVTIAVLSGIQAMIGAFQALGAAIDSIKFGFMAIQNLLLQTQKTALTVLSVLPKALRGGLAGVNIKEAQAVIAQTQEGLAKRGAALTRETPSPISELLNKFQQSLQKTKAGLPSAAPGTPSGIVPQQKIIMEITVNSTETTEIANLQATEAFKTGQLQLNIKQVQNTARQVAR